jgi:hypothetical protein
MPFSSQFEPRWKDIFEPAIVSCDLKPYRTKERLVSDSIPIDVLEGIGSAKLLLFDISNEKKDQPNSNVMYELGIAHAIRMPEEVIIVRMNNQKVVLLILDTSDGTNFLRTI